MQFTISIPENHLSLSGHFPDNPIVPGAVLLDYFLEELSARNNGLKVQALHNVKFLHPVLPGRELEVDLEQDSVGKAAFKLKLGDLFAVVGTVVYR